MFSDPTLIVPEVGILDFEVSVIPVVCESVVMAADNVVVTPFELPSPVDLNKTYSLVPFTKVIFVFATSQ